MKITELKIDPKFAGKIPPLTDEECRPPEVPGEAYRRNKVLTEAANGNESRLGLPAGRSLPRQSESVQGIGAGREAAGAGSAEQYREPAQLHDYRGRDHFAGEKEGTADALSPAAGRAAEDGIGGAAGADQND